MKKIVLNVMLVFITLITNGQINKDMNIKRVLEKQLNAGSDLSYVAQDYGKDDLLAASDYLSDYLKSKGYQMPQQNRFDSLVYSIFGVKKNEKNTVDRITIINKEGNFCDTDTSRAFMLDELGKSDYYIDWKNRIFFEAYFLPEIINYQTEYPEMAKIEDSPIEIYDNIEETNTVLRQWKDISNLKTKREKNLRITLSRNRYLFNDQSKADLEWLRQNDYKFTLNLLRIFGYDTDEKLNESALLDGLRHYKFQRGFKPDQMYFGQLFNYIDCSGKLHIRYGLINHILKFSAEKTDFNTLREYFKHLYYYVLEIEKNKIIPIQDMAKLICSASQLQADVIDINSNVKDSFIISYNGITPKIFAEAKKNNFYGRDFKNVVKLMLYKWKYDEYHDQQNLANDKYRWMLQDFVGVPRESRKSKYGF